MRDGALEADDGTGLVETVMLGSLQPKKPGDLQAGAELLDDEDLEEVVVRVGTGTTVCVVTVVVSVYVVDPFLQPNQPGVRHVVTVVVLVCVTGLDVVDSSKHPHHPGVKHVAVRDVVLVDELLLEVVVELLLLS